MRSETPRKLGSSSGKNIHSVGGLPSGGAELLVPQPVPVPNKESCRDASENHRKLNAFLSDFHFANHLLDGRDGGARNFEAKRLFTKAKEVLKKTRLQKLQRDLGVDENGQPLKDLASESSSIGGLNLSLEGGAWGSRAQSLFNARESALSRNLSSASVKSRTNSLQNARVTTNPTAALDTEQEHEKYSGLPLHAGLSKRLLQLSTPRVVCQKYGQSAEEPGVWVPPMRKISVFSKKPHMVDS